MVCSFVFVGCGGALGLSSENGGYNLTPRTGRMPSAGAGKRYRLRCNTTAAGNLRYMRTVVLGPRRAQHAQLNTLHLADSAFFLLRGFSCWFLNGSLLGGDANRCPASTLLLVHGPDKSLVSPRTSSSYGSFMSAFFGVVSSMLRPNGSLQEPFEICEGISSRVVALLVWRVVCLLSSGGKHYEATIMQKRLSL